MLFHLVLADRWLKANFGAHLNSLFLQSKSGLLAGCDPFRTLYISTPWWLTLNGVIPCVGSPTSNVRVQKSARHQHRRKTLRTAPIGVFVCPGKEDRAPLPLLYSHNQSVGKISKPTNNVGWVYSIGWMNKGKKVYFSLETKRTESIYWCKALIESTIKFRENFASLFPHPPLFRPSIVELWPGVSSCWCVFGSYRSRSPGNT